MSGQTVKVFITDYNLKLLRKYISTGLTIPVLSDTDKLLNQAVNNIIEYALDREGPLPPFPTEEGKRST